MGLQSESFSFGPDTRGAVYCGRNGCSKVHGMYVMFSDRFNIVAIHPMNSRGFTSACSIEFPANREIYEKLLTIMEGVTLESQEEDKVDR